MALWEGKSLDELRALAAGRDLDQDPFHVLLAKLAQQRRQDVDNAVRSLQKENDRLRAELGPKQDADPASHPQAVLGMSINSSIPLQARWCVTPPVGPPALPGMIVDSSALQDAEATDTYPPDVPTTPDLDFANFRHGGADGDASARGRRSAGLTRNITTTVPFTPKATAKRAHLSGAAEDLGGQNRSKYIRHLRQILNLNRSTVSNRKLFVDAPRLLAALENQGLHHYSAERVLEIVCELSAIDVSVELEVKRTASTASLPIISRGTTRTSLHSATGCSRIALLKLVDLLMLPALPDLVDPAMEEDVRAIQHTLLRRDTNLEGLIESATQVGCVETVYDDTFSGWRLRYQGFLQYLDAVTIVVVILSLFVLGLSMDIEPNWFGWIFIEGFFCMYLVCEVAIKLVWIGPRGYFCGGDRYLHLLDLFVSVLACVDLVITCATYDVGGKTGGSKLTTLLRFFRTARILRLVQLMKSRTLKELADLFTGFIIGMPWLFWVMVILFFTTYSVALIFRQVVGPSEDERFMYKCGSADSITNPDDPDCQARTLYGEEFFGSVPDSMFTLFRCMIGDCSTKGGQALAAHFSASYGLRFQVIYSIGMIGVIFGLFNIITALFVEATLNGLKSSDMRSKYRSQYDRRFVQAKLKALIKRVCYVIDRAERRPSDAGARRASVTAKTDFQDIAMSEAVFLTVIQDRVVGGILDDLDVSHFNRECLFDVFDTDGTGMITLRELVDTLMHLRGEPQKSDAVASFLALRRLRDNFQSSMYALLENQEQIIRDQQEQWQVRRDEVASKEMPRRDLDEQDSSGVTPQA